MVHMTCIESDVCFKQRWTLCFIYAETQKKKPLLLVLVTIYFLSPKQIIQHNKDELGLKYLVLVLVCLVLVVVVVWFFNWDASGVNECHMPLSVYGIKSIFLKLHLQTHVCIEVIMRKHKTDIVTAKYFWKPYFRSRYNMRRGNCLLQHRYT